MADADQSEGTAKSWAQVVGKLPARLLTIAAALACAVLVILVTVTVIAYSRGDAITVAGLDFGRTKPAVSSAGFPIRLIVKSSRDAVIDVTGTTETATVFVSCNDDTPVSGACAQHDINDRTRQLLSMGVVPKERGGEHVFACVYTGGPTTQLEAFVYCAPREQLKYGP